MGSNESPQRVGASERSGGTSSSHRIADLTDTFVPHGCVESLLVWSLLAGEIPVPNTPAWKALYDFAEAIALRRLAAIRPVLAVSDMDASITNRYAQRRDTYATPPKTAAQIRAEVKHSHAKWEREIAERWAAA